MNDIDSDELVCEICKDALSEPPNEIVICDNCNKGFHQLCHTPPIPKEIVVQQDCSWVCRQCYYVMTNEEKIKLNIISSEALITKSTKSKLNGNNQINSSKSLLINKNVSNKSIKNSPSNQNDNLLNLDLDNETNEICKELPYELDDLNWDDDHLTNRDNIYCYCGRGIEYCRSMLQCVRCSQWFHYGCINSLKNGELLIGDQYFKFVCSVCNEGSEICQRIIMKWSVVCGLILSNLTYGGDKRFFNIQDMIIFLKENENQFKLNVPLNKLQDKELYDKLEMNLKANKDKFMFKKEKDEIKWALNVSIPYDDPLTFSPYSSNISSTLVKQKSSTNSTDATIANQTKSLANNSKILLDGACRKNAAKSPPKVDNKLINQINKSNKDNITTTTKNKKKSTTRRSNSVSSANSIELPNLLELAKNKSKTTTPQASKRKTNSNSLLLKSTSSKHIKIKKEEDIKDLDSLIPFPPTFEGEENPFHSKYDEKQDIELKKKFKKELNDNKLNDETTENCLLNNNSTTINSFNQSINNNNSLMCNHNEKPNYRVVNNDGSNKLIISRVNNHENSFNNNNNSSNNLLNNQNYLNGNSNGKLLNQHDGQFDGKMNFKILAQRKIINNEIEYMLECTDKL